MCGADVLALHGIHDTCFNIRQQAQQKRPIICVMLGAHYVGAEVLALHTAYMTVF